MNKVPVVVHPVDFSVAAQNAIFDVIQLILIIGYLLSDTGFDGIQIVAVDYPAERITGVLLKLF